MFDVLRIKEILEEDQKLNEGRPTNTFGLARELKKLPSAEKIVNVESMSDGMAVMLRTKDGQAYEILIRPMEFAKYFDVPKPK